MNTADLQLNLELSLIQQQELRLLESIRAGVRHHVTTWRKVPALAWEAAKKDETHTITYSMACNYGLWPVCLDRDGWYAGMWVDCATGELVDADKPLKPVSDEKLRCLYTKLHLVDPNIVIEVLRDRIGSGFGEVGDFLWMQAINAEQGISNPFVRIEALPERVSTQLVESD